MKHKNLFKSLLAMILAGTCVVSASSGVFAASSSAEITASADNIIAASAAAETDINAANRLETYFNNGAGQWSVDPALDTVKDGVLTINTKSDTTRTVSHKVTNNRAYNFEIRMRVAKDGNEHGFKLENGKARIMMYVKESYASLQTEDGSLAITAFKPGEFNTYKFEVVSNQAMVYCNDKLEGTVQLRTWPSDTGISVFAGSKGTAHAKIEVDYIKYEHADTTIAIATPSAGATLVEGGKTTLKCEVAATADVPYVDYYANGTHIGTATKEQGYALEWKNLCVGTYVINAKYGEFSAVDTPISVIPKTGTPTVEVDKTDVALGESVTISLKRKPSNVEKITIFINGKEYESNDGSLTYKTDILGKIVAAAKIYYKDGSFQIANPVEITTTATVTDGIVLQNNYIATYTAENGGKITASDGVYALEIAHSDSKVTYMTADGEKTYDLGLGDYRVAVDGGVCDVDYNGKFAFSFIMPLTEKANGITATGVKGLELSGINATLYETKKYDGSAELIPEIRSDYAVEFVLDDPTNFALLLADGAFVTELTAYNGSLVAVTDPTGTRTDGSENTVRVGTVATTHVYEDSEDVTLCTMPEGRHAYRITNSNGICQLFIDNVWKASFRLPSVFSVPSVQAKGIKNVVIRQTNDLYVFDDSFDNAGEFDSKEYYHVDNALIPTYNDGSLTVEFNADAIESEAAGLVSEMNEFDNRWGAQASLTFADGTMLLSTTATSAVTSAATVKYSKNYEIEVRLRVPAFGGENGFKFEYNTHRIMAYFRNGSVTIGDKTITLNPSEWHTYKFVASDPATCEIFVDGVSKGIANLQARATGTPVLAFFAKSTDGTKPASMEVDYIRYKILDADAEPEYRVTVPVQLKAYAYTPTVSATVRVDSATKGNIYLAARYQNMYRNLLAGYNFDTKQWEIIETNPKAKTIGVSDSPFPFGQDVKLELVVGEKTAVLYVNGEREVSTNQASLAYYGTVGVCVGYTTATISDFHYEGTGRALPGAISYITNTTSPDVFEFEEGHIYVISGSSKAVESVDDGYNFKQNNSVGKFSNNTIRLKSGTIVYTVRKSEGNGNYRDYSYVSTDNGATFAGPFPIQSYLRNRITMNNKLTEASNGRLFFASGESGDGVEGEGGIRVFYSDDEGRTWTGANIMGLDGKLITGDDEARMDAENTGVNCQESRVVEMPDGTFRLYVRTDNGFLYYSVSTDNGATWSAMMYPSEFISVLSAFNIERDPHTGYYYMAWEYNNKNDHNTFQYPRSRTGLAVSYDGMETWEYVGDIHEVSASHKVFSHMNIGLKPTKNAIYVTTVHYEPNADGSQSNVNYMVRVDKDTMKTTERFSKVHTLNPLQPSSIQQNAIDTMALINSDCSLVWTAGKVYVIDDAIKGYISSNVAAAFLGAIHTEEGNTVTIQLLNHEVVFTEGSKTAKVNGKDVALSAEVKAGKIGLMIPVDVLTSVYGRDVKTLENGAMLSVYDRNGLIDTRALSAYVPNGLLSASGSALNVPSTWAQNEVYAADNVNIIPAELKFNYREKITREEFCELIMQMLCKVNGAADSKALLEAKGIKFEDNFTDTDNEDVICANLLGILNGRGNGIFDPSSGITRQEAAVMLSNTAKLLGIKAGTAPEFKDSDKMASWAADAINTVTAIECSYGSRVMGGVGNDMFDPLGAYTREQSILTVYRLFMS